MVGREKVGEITPSEEVAGKALIIGMTDNSDVDVVDGVLMLGPGKAPVDRTPPGGNGRGIGTNPPGPVPICGAGAALTGITNSNDRARIDSVIVAMLITKSRKEWMIWQPLVYELRGYAVL